MSSCNVSVYNERWTRDFCIVNFDMCLESDIPPLMTSHPVFRIEHVAEWPAQAAHEGPLCGAVSHGTSAAELSLALSAHVDGSLGVCPQWVSDISQPRPEDPGVVRGQPAT